MARRYLLAGILSGAVVVLDQATKAEVREVFPLWSSRPMIEGFFSLVHVANKGAAFGFLNREDIGWQNGLFIAVTLLAAMVIFLLLRGATDRERLYAAGLGLVLGGAVGNVIDRLRFGYVVDFLDFHYGDYHWPAFNVADMAICIGAGLIILSVLTSRRHAPHSH
jgi:signal peptidase II